MTDARPAAVIVLAAGEGRRMKSATPKVLHTMCGRTLLGHVLATIEPLQPERLLVVLGHERPAVEKFLAEAAPHAQVVVQDEQLGTGHAARVAIEAAADLRGSVLVMHGDTPLFTTETLSSVLERQLSTGALAAMLTAEMPDPFNYGRILRDADGHVTAIVEERDADERTKQITEICTGVYAFDAVTLRDALERIAADNAQREEYLTDVIGRLVEEDKPVVTVVADDWQETLGVNDRVQLADARRIMRDRIVAHWMREGVTITDPQTTWMGVGVRLEPDVVLHQNTQLHGSTLIRTGAVVGPDCTLTNTTVESDATVMKSTCDGAAIGAGATVGPYSYLRPGTKVGAGAKVGAFVETKNAELGEGAKVPHLTYVGDATIGEGSNIGAGTVFVNYDGVDKHHTTVGEHAFVGSGTMLVGPREIGDGAYVAAGSVITDDVPPGDMGVARGRQRNIVGWVFRRRAGTKSADAARRAGAGGTMEGTSPPSSDDPQGEQP